MASAVPAFRFVKCPKCLKLLTEFSDIPVYECGGCGTVLRAKNRVPTVDGTTSAARENNSQNVSDGGSLEVDGGVERAVAHSDIQVSNSGSANNSDRKEEFSEPGEGKQVNQGQNSSETTGMNAAVSHDRSVSSSDKSQEDRIPNKYSLLSKRTFRRKKVSDSDDITKKEEEVQSFDISRDELPCKSRILTLERDTTFGSEDFHSVQNWMGSEADQGAPRSPSKVLPFRGDSLNCPTRHNNYLEPEPDHMKILRKVDELRDELTGFLTKTVEEKGASRIPRIPVSGQPLCSCLAHPHNINCHSNLPSCLHKAKAEEREKKLPIKSYCRPVSGGAPFVICYKCWELLQLPADFLVTPKRLHRLQCGTCSQVLVFSFRPRARTVPQTPTEAQHPPSEDDRNSDGRISFAKSYSSEAEPVLNVSRNSSSRLHRLMGYSSASELLFRTASVSEGYQSTQPSTPQFYRPLAEDDVRYRRQGSGTDTPNSTEIQEEEYEPQERLRTQRRGSALQGLLKKGVKELSHGLESIKLKGHSNG